MALRVSKANIRLMWMRKFPTPIQTVLYALCMVSYSHRVRGFNLLIRLNLTPCHTYTAAANTRKKWWPRVRDATSSWVEGGV